LSEENKISPGLWEYAESRAQFFGHLETDNFLAHTIRKIEKKFFEEKLERRHSFSIQIQEIARDSYEVEFCDRGCVIRIFTEGVAPQAIRIRLAHELGHIVYDFHDLSPSKVDRSSLPEEFFCWVFAYGLIKTKSDQYRSMNAFKDFQYTDRQLASSIIAFAEKADIYDGELKTNLEQYFKIKRVPYS